MSEIENDDGTATASQTALAEAEPRAVAPQVGVFRAALPSLNELAWMAKMLAGTQDGRTPATVTLPRALQGKPADVLAIMLAGRELGIGPMQATPG